MKSFIRGLLAGAAIGILTAPREGKKTRRQLSDKFYGYKDQLNDARDKMMGVVEEVKTKAGYGSGESLTDQAEREVDAHKFKAKRAVVETKHDYNEGVENLADKAKETIDDAERNLKM